jgi:hypothetical protein
MSFIRWMRKNNTKIMAVVVIILMIAFVGGSSLSYLLQPKGYASRTVATMSGNIKVKGYDLQVANRELEILRMLKADVILGQMIRIPMSNTPDLQAFFLGELLFSEQKTSPILMNYIKQTIRSNLYDISEKQINDIYKRTTLPGSDVYWHCLKTEARLAGIRIPNENVGEQLGRAIPMLFEGRNYSQIINSIVNQHGITEQQILEAFGNLLSVLQYAHLICADQDITTRQLMQTVAWESEGINVEFVEFNSTDFSEEQETPGEDAIAEHFNKYKKYFAGEINEENPYGFGYKLYDRIQLEYIVLKLDDVSTIIKSPTQDEMENYYDRYKEQMFTEQVPIDPNDPNSPMTERIRPYSSVANIISKQLKQDKIDVKAEGIIQEAVSLTETSMQDMNETQLDKLGPEELAKLAGDYKTAAEQLSQKYKIKVYTGRTGLLDAIEMQFDKYLSRMYLSGYNQNPVMLTKVVFAVPQIAASELGPFDIQTPRMYMNIGPARDTLELQGGTGEMIAIVRVVEAVKATEPNNVDYTFSIKPLVFDPNAEQEKEDVYSVKEKVIEDLKKLAALKTAKSRAEEFIGVVSNEDWQGAADKFNEMYGKETKSDPNDPNSPVTKTFQVENFTGMRIISKDKLDALAALNKGNPAAQYFANERIKSSSLVKELHSLIPADSNSVKNLPLIMEFKPDMSYFCIKNLTIKRLWKEDYDKIKTRRLFTEDNIQSQNLSVIHFNPENILKRMNFKLVNAKESTSTAPVESAMPPDTEDVL